MWLQLKWLYLCRWPVSGSELYVIVRLDDSGVFSLTKLKIGGKMTGFFFSFKPIVFIILFYCISDIFHLLYSFQDSKFTAAT